MLGPGRYSQWRSCFLRYIDTKPNGERLRKGILSGPYVPSTVLVQAVDATEVLSEKEAIFLLLTGIGDDIYSTVDACKTANEMWIAIERLQQGKEIAKPVTPQSESVSEEDSDPEQAQRDKEHAKRNLALLLVVQQNRDTVPLSAREFGHYAKECRKPKHVKDYSYHKEKIMMCKQAEQGVPLQAEQADWIADMDKEIDEQEMEAHYSFMAKIQEDLKAQMQDKNIAISELKKLIEKCKGKSMETH
ncbi:hypothetical protein Tco_0390914 [Tanacetum coccineum]